MNSSHSSHHLSKEPQSSRGSGKTTLLNRILKEIFYCMSIRGWWFRSIEKVHLDVHMSGLGMWRKMPLNLFVLSVWGLVACCRVTSCRSDSGTKFAQDLCRQACFNNLVTSKSSNSLNVSHGRTAQEFHGKRIAVIENEFGEVARVNPEGPWHHVLPTKTTVWP